MRATMKAILFGSIAAIALLFAMPGTADAHPWGRPWHYPAYSYYYGSPYATYYGWSSPGYYDFGVPAYRYRPYRYHDYYGYYYPRGAVRVGPLGVWW